jgi:hypothetical protein
MVHIIGLLGLFLWATASTPEQRAADYLGQEVPKWAKENHCYSCHNNGDGARALLAARRSGLTVAPAALADTVEWLRQPAKWKDAEDAPGVKNIALAHIQFASALLDANLSDRKPLAEAAAAVERLQDRDGSWKVDAGGIPGAPATYGVALATYMARRVLIAAGSTDAAARAAAWLREARLENIVDAAAIALGIPERRDAIDYLKRRQNRDGGWGETFDTAVAILALHRAGETAMVERGRAALLRLQQEAGGWQETTRPPGGVSYAEHISTTGWALYALLETGPKRQ